MKYYITHPVNETANANDYRIIKVQEADEANFLEDYSDKIIASGSSLMEALMNFEKVKNESGG
jgi:DNA-directed RNA polymerase subunit L